MMKKVSLILLLTLFASVAPLAMSQIRGTRGALIVQASGDPSRQSPRVWELFIKLAGGRNANFVYIPTADDPIDAQHFDWHGFPHEELKHLTVLHTRCRPEADSEAFVAPLREANGVWFGPGRQFRLADAYLHTLTQAVLKTVLDRGGVIGGIGAGGTMLMSYTVRGGILDEKVLMAKGHEEGFGFLNNLTIDQRVDIKKREEELVPVISAHPELLGLGLEDSTAILLRGNELEVIGPGRVAITDGKDHDGKPYYYLNAGNRFDLKRRARL